MQVIKINAMNLFFLINEEKFQYSIFGTQYIYFSQKFIVQGED